MIIFNPFQTSATEEYTPTAPGYKTSSTSDELTIPLLLPSRTRSQQNSRHEKVSTPTIPLQLPVTPREIADNMNLAPLTNTNIPPPILPNVNIPPLMSSSSTIPLNLPKTRSKNIITPPGLSPVVVSQSDNKGSVLSSLSEEELIRKANEMLGESDNRDETPEPDESEQNAKYSPKSDIKSAPVIYNPTKRPKIDVSQPPIPGLEDEDFH